jgi:hypothetical protein
MENSRRSFASFQMENRIFRNASCLRDGYTNEVSGKHMENLNRRNKGALIEVLFKQPKPSQSKE